MSDADEIYRAWMAKRTPKRPVRVVVERKPEPEPPVPPKERPRVKPSCTECSKHSAESIKKMTTF